MKKQAEQTSLRRGIVSVIIGLALAVLLQIGASHWVGAQTGMAGQGFTMSDVVPFITTNSSSPMSRIGSLAVGSSVVPGWILSINESNICTRNNVPPGINLTSLSPCLSVVGDSTFYNLWVTPPALLDRVLVTDDPSTGGGEGGFSWEVGFGPRFVIEEDPEGNSSMLVSGLGRYEGGVFNPQNLSTQRGVCASINGTLVPCSGLNPVIGACGSAHDGTFSTIPGSGLSGEPGGLSGSTGTLCATGTPSSVVDNGTFADPRWSWTCAGANGGANASCFASYSPATTPVHGVCKDYSGIGTGYETQPATNNETGCEAGEYANLFDTETD